MSKYLQIARSLIDDIENQHLGINEKLPSLRALMALHHVSMTTALACYRYMEKSGYALAQNKKGYYVSKPFGNIKAVPFPQFESVIVNPSPKTQSSCISMPTDNLAVAKLDTRLMDMSLLKSSLQASIKRLDFTLDYEKAQGNEQLRAQLSHHLSQQGFTTPASQLVITNGCLDAVANALEITSNSGDAIAVSSPCYSGLLELLSLLGRAVIELPSTANGIDLVQLESFMADKKIKACLLTANHQNPTGHSLSNQQKRKIAQLATTYQIPIIEDDVYRELSHQVTPQLPIKYFDNAGWVLWCSSLSKTLAPGLRLGWCNPGRFLTAYTQHCKIKSLGVNQPIQRAVADYMSKGHYTRHLKRINLTLTTHLHIYIEHLKLNLPANVQINMPQGGLVVWLKIEGMNAKEVALKLLKKQVFVQSGGMFSTTNYYNDCIRINIGLIPDDKILGQIKLLGDAIKQHF